LTQDKSLSFLIYTFYAVFLWCTYFGFTRIYFNILEDWLNVSSTTSFYLFSVDYGRAATLLLIATIGLLVTRYFSLKLAKAGNISLDAASRLWMLRLILLAASLSALSDIYILLTSFMVGIGTAIEIYKALITLVIATGVIIFSLCELRLKTMAKTHLLSIYSGLFVALALGTISSAIYKAPPWVMRLVRDDFTKIDKMEKIAGKINHYYTQHKTVHAKLTDLEEYMKAEDLNDPATGQPFGYKAINEKTYEICGMFKTDKTQVPRHMSRWGGTFNKMTYQKGRSCFKQQAHKE
jgi:hypothetical protein